MNQRPLGRTGLQVSEIGYGAWGIGQSMWLGADDDESVRALERDVVVATKIPPKNGVWPAPDGQDPDEAFPADYVIECTERSLGNLGLDTIDLQQFHVWSDEWVGRGSWLDGIEQLKADGRIRAFGVSINDHQPANAIKLVESGAVDAVQVIYNVFDQSPEDELLPACAEHGVGVLARVPFDEGSLTGNIGPDTEFPEGDFRNRYFRDGRKQEVADHVQAILDDLGIEREQLPEVALRYILSQPAVSTVIPGMRTVRNVERNAALGDGKGLPDERVAALKRHRWERNFYKP
jgi:aryl-alcohol dehydrogenase-like predicted oxidoreductase